MTRAQVLLVFVLLVGCTKRLALCSGNRCDAASEPPQITSIVGNSGRQPSRLATGIVIKGENLGRITSLRLLSSSMAVLGDLVVTASDATTVAADLPAKLAADALAQNGGELQIELATNAGVARQSAVVLQGEIGPPGPPGPPGPTTAESITVQNARNDERYLQLSGGVITGKVVATAAGFALPITTTVVSSVPAIRTFPGGYNGYVFSTYAACPSNARPIGGGCAIYHPNPYTGVPETGEATPYGCFAANAKYLSTSDLDLCLMSGNEKTGDRLTDGSTNTATYPTVQSLGYKCMVNLPNITAPAFNVQAYAVCLRVD